MRVAGTVVGILILVAIAAGYVRRPLAGDAGRPPAGEGPRVPAGTPTAVAALLDGACADCHSDNTRWPWYAGVPPASWLVAGHVRQGRRFVNFSHFDERSEKDRRDILRAIEREVKSGSMPLRSYTLLHPRARLSPRDRAAIVSWAASTAN